MTQLQHEALIAILANIEGALYFVGGAIIASAVLVSLRIKEGRDR